MIHTNDLMIGNIVINKEIEGKPRFSVIKGIGGDGLYTESIWYENGERKNEFSWPDFEKIEAIKFTIEICRIISLLRSYDNETFFLSQEEFELSVDVNQNANTDLATISSTMAMALPHINCLHELQNIFYWLSNKKLVIDERIFKQPVVKG